nr:hypothetical protein [Pseudomonas sp. KNUC1026]
MKLLCLVKLVTGAISPAGTQPRLTRYDGRNAETMAAPPILPSNGRPLPIAAQVAPPRPITATMIGRSGLSWSIASSPATNTSSAR